MGQPSKIDELVSDQAGSIVIREIINKSTGRVPIFAFDEGQGLSAHAARFDALGRVVEGETQIVLLVRVEPIVDLPIFAGQCLARRFYRV